MLANRLNLVTHFILPPPPPALGCCNNDLRVRIMPQHDTVTVSSLSSVCPFSTCPPIDPCRAIARPMRAGARRKRRSTKTSFLSGLSKYRRTVHMAPARLTCTRQQPVVCACHHVQALARTSVREGYSSAGSCTGQTRHMQTNAGAVTILISLTLLP